MPSRNRSTITPPRIVNASIGGPIAPSPNNAMIFFAKAVAQLERKVPSGVLYEASRRYLAAQDLAARLRAVADRLDEITVGTP